MPTLKKFTHTVAIATVIVLATALPARAACMNKFVYRSESSRQNVTLLTGRLTFQEAQDLSAAIAAKKSPPVEWVDDTGKTIARQFGELKIVRPMPVGCDGKPSGVVINVVFASPGSPAKKMSVRFNEQTTVEFEEQK